MGSNESKNVRTPDGRHVGFRGKDGRLYLERCPECGLENWAVAVASGRCAWCGHGPDDDKEADGRERTEDPN